MVLTKHWMSECPREREERTHMTVVGIINMGVNTSLFNKLDIYHPEVKEMDNYLEDFPEICGLAGSATDRLVQKHIQETRHR
jgi:hypothetical protein